MKRIYETDAYQNTCGATVQSCEMAADGRWAVIFDQTCFFPEAGGQVCDLGWIERNGDTGDNRIPVRDVQVDSVGVVIHYCDAPIHAGASVTLSIDWKRRYELMQQHSGEHIVSGIVHTHFGYRNVGFHLNDHLCTMDYDGALGEEDIRFLEREANAWIFRDVPITCDYPDDNDLAAIDYRCKGELTPPIRIVTIGEGDDLADCCACCAPHVRSTGEIGLLKVTGAQTWKGGTRLTMVCGGRALADYQEKHDIIRSLEQILSVPHEKLVNRLTETLAGRDGLRAEIVALQRRLLAVEMEAIPPDARDALIFMDEALSIDDKTIRFSVNTLMKSHEGLCGIFYGNDTEGYRFILGSLHVDVSGLAESLRSGAGAKCGGSKQMIQGSILSAKQDILRHIKMEQ